LLVAIGLGIGLGGALALTRMLESLLFEISPTDPVTLAGVAVTLGATALLASVAPAWRASTVDPLVTLRVG
jgi:ABC-type lipoprotein release transport system permease subunit